MDHRKGSESIGSMHDYQQLHHMHCLSRIFHTNPDIIHQETLGSFFPLHARAIPNMENFDFLDLTNAGAILLRIEDTCLISVLNDSCASATKFLEVHQDIGRNLSPVQLREIAARLGFLNIHIKLRPEYYSKFTKGQKYELTAKLPTPGILLNELDYSILGKMMLDVLKPIVGPNNEILAGVETGRATFLSDESGAFKEHEFTVNSRAV
ncbi:hypothetical protein [Oligoflexus tunisiensis]|uniref:hypothetical protein n=1 Tax=Oligoflexus tunisiensis TaxID=708132 RepID=UPI001C402AAC|nr:hypothetical protein [Oligoflexus tunisiensis]